MDQQMGQPDKEIQESKKSQSKIKTIIPLRDLEFEPTEPGHCEKLFRSRPYKKNDQCFVEQKNYTHIRELIGYDRYSGKLMMSLMNKIYRNEWRLLSNYFYPQIRLKEKIRIGSKVKRTFHPPITPTCKPIEGV